MEVTRCPKCHGILKIKHVGQSNTLERHCLVCGYKDSINALDNKQPIWKNPFPDFWPSLGKEILGFN